MPVFGNAQIRKEMDESTQLGRNLQPAFDYF
jgi:hypothetical protein